MESGREDILRRVGQALSREPYIFVVEKGDEELKRAIEETLRDEGLWGIVTKEEAGPLIIYYVDKGKIAKLCSYESCSNIEDSVEFEACVQKCVDAKIENIVKLGKG